MVVAGIDGNVVVVVEYGNRNLLVAVFVLLLEGNKDVVVMLVKERNNNQSDEKTTRSKKEVNSSWKRGKVRRFLVDAGERYTTIKYRKYKSTKLSFTRKKIRLQEYRELKSKLPQIVKGINIISVYRTRR